MVNNYTHIGFLPGNSLQSSELNELQERFYLNQTLDNNLISNWLIFTDDYSNITGSTFDNYLGIPSSGILPLNPNLVEINESSSDLVIKINPGWYRINDFKTSNISLWTYLEEETTLTLSINTSDDLYTVKVDISIEEVLSSSIEEEEGYQFNSNTGGFIEPWIQGSNRLKLIISKIELVLPIEQSNGDILLCKIKKGIDNVPSNNFLIQYPNNYKINVINIT
jgi:hypothetical protein